MPGPRDSSDYRICLCPTPFSGTDHHSNGFAPGWESRIEPDSTPIKIDGFIGSGVPYRINHPRFVNCSIQTRESASIVLDRVIRPTFINCRAESGPVRASPYTVLPGSLTVNFHTIAQKRSFRKLSTARVHGSFRECGGSGISILGNTIFRWSSK